MDYSGVRNDKLTSAICRLRTVVLSGDVLSGALGVRCQQSVRQALVVRSAVAVRTGWARKRAAPLRAFLQTESGSAGILLGRLWSR